MKKIIYLGGLLLLFLSTNAMAQEEPTKIKIKITGENGKVVEKEYDSAEALENDPELKELGVEVEADNGRIRMKSNGNNSVVIQQNSGKGGGNHMYIQQGPGLGAKPPGPGMPSHPGMPPHPPTGMNDPDSFMREEQARMMQMRDSLLSRHHERREEHRREMEERRAEMRQRMAERRGVPRNEKQLIIIDHLTKNETTLLGIKNENLNLEDLRILPDPGENTLSLGFSATGRGPVQIKLSDSANRLLLDETYELSDKNFDKTFELEGFEKGVYYLQIIRNNRTLSRRISVQ